MRQRWIAALLGLALLPLSGCQKTLDFLPYAREIEHMALMRTMGVDAGEGGDTVRVTVSSGVQSKGAEKGDQPPTVLTRTAGTISGACLSMQAEGASYIYYGHVGELLLGETLATRGAGSTMDYVLRDPEMRLDTVIYVVKGASAEKAITTAAEGGSSAAERLDAMEDDAGLISHSMPRTVKEVLEDLSGTGSTFLPAVTLISERDKTAMTAAGYAVLKDGALAGWIEGAAANGVNLLLGKVDADVVELNVPGLGVAAVRVVGAKTHVAPVFQGGRLTGLAVTCRVEANLAEAPTGLDLRDRDQVNLLNHLLAEVERARVQSVLALFQALEADFLGLKERAGLAAPWRWNEIQAQWDPAALDMEVAVQAAVRRSYDVNQ